MSLSRLSVAHRILLVVAIAMITPALMSVQLLLETRRSLLESRASEVRHLDEAAWTLVASYHDLTTKGVMTVEAAQEAAKTAIRAMHYDGGNYFFIWDLNGNGVAHGGNRSLEGKNFMVGPDAAERPGVADMVRKLVTISREEKQELVRYHIPKAGQLIALEKIGYSKLFEPWGWAVGTGAYLTDIDTFFWSQVRNGLIAALGLMGLSGMLSYMLGRDLSRSLAALTRAVRVLTGGDLGIMIPSLERGDEIGVMARAMQAFKHTSILAGEQGAELQTTSARLEAALDNMVQGLCVHDSDGRLQIFNHQFCDMIGVKNGDVKAGMTLHDMLYASFTAGNYPGRNFEDVVAERHAVIERGEPVAMVVELAANRLLSIVQCPMPNGGWVATYEDVTERRAADAKITYLARHDILTALPNRLVLAERIEEALREADRGIKAAVLCLDLDEFKRVNDTLGHPVGDALLVAAAERLQTCMSEGDTLARVGGDEFVLVQTAIARLEDATERAERIIASMREPFIICGHQIVLGVSVGIAFVPEDGRDQATVLKNADIALYRTKAEERGTFCCFEASMDARLQLRRELEVDMRAGLTRGEFELFYQPLVDLAGKAVVGFEALVRWRHPQRGMISPGEFIPLAEEIGFIIPLGEWVMRQACREAATWPDGIKVAVNLSPCQFKSRNLPFAIVAALKDVGLPPNRLELEITETLLLQDSEATLAMLHDIRALGVRIALDDFGTGYSSLSYLRSFPFDKIKIDQSFVRDLSKGEESRHIVRAILDLCAALGMSTTAEGVETDEQLAKIHAEGCTEVQGYLFSRPRPASEVTAVLSEVSQMRASILLQQGWLVAHNDGSRAA